MNTLLGVGFAFVRDQGQPWYIPQEVKDAGGYLRFPWKRVAIGLFGLWHGLLAWLVVPWWAALLVAAWAAPWWSKGHEGGLDMQDDRDWPAMGLTGIAVSAGLGLAWTIWGNPVWGGLLLLSGALKPVCYWAAYQLRGRNAPWPHATAFGAMAHGATMGFAIDLAVLMWLLG